MLALCLAYIALPNFRYRDQIGQLALSALRHLDEKGAASDTKCENHYARLVRLSGPFALPSHKEHLHLNGKAIPESEDDGPGRWFFTSNNSFNVTPDIVITFLCAFLTVVVLASDVAHTASINFFGLAKALSVPGVIWVAFYAMLVSMLIPLSLIFFGRKRVFWATERVAYLQENCEKQLKAGQISDQIPNDPPGQKLPARQPKKLDSAPKRASATANSASLGKSARRTADK